MAYFTNKVAVITGAANGLGKVIAIELKRQGCHLALLDVDSNGLEQLRSELTDNVHRVSTHMVDISQEGQIIAAREEILREHKQVDLLINNAAVSISQPFKDVSISDYKWLMDINFWGTVYCTKYFLADLQKSGDSRLVNIISEFAYLGFPGKTTYGSSKGAIMGFTNSLKTELHGSNVKVSLVIPPPMDTGLVKNGKHIDEQKKDKEETFLQRNGMPVYKAAVKIVKGIERGRYRIVVGPMMFCVDLAARVAPALSHRLVSINRKRFEFV
jgi:short-subunit dehydrogenase